MKYEDMTFEVLGTHRQRPMYLRKFTTFRSELDMATYPRDPHAYTEIFLDTIDKWIASHQYIKYNGLESFSRRDVILGTTHQLDELHLLHGENIVVYNGEYKYHRRLTNHSVRQINTYTQLRKGDVFIVSYPSCITTGKIDEFDELLDYCAKLYIPVHIDGAWFGQCRNIEISVDHPAIQSVSVSLSKALGMGNQRIGIRYTKDRVNGPIAIMNDFGYVNASDMWLGVEATTYFGADYWWANYGELYTKVCKDFDLLESDSIHAAWKDNILYGIRTPLRMLIEGIYDERGTDKGLSDIERKDRSNEVWKSMPRH